MRTATSLLLIMFGAIVASGAEELPADLIARLTKAIRERCPDAEISAKGAAFSAKFGTMMFTVHYRSMTGEVSKETRQEEGPNFRGFVLSVSLQNGRYEGQAMVPQALKEPYFETYIDAVPTEDAKGHFWIRFSYGSRTDSKLKEAIFAALPKEK
jgi:hypothetical protein